MNQFFSKYKRETIIVAIVLLVVLVIWYLVRRAKAPTSTNNPGGNPTPIKNQAAQQADQVKNALESFFTTADMLKMALEGVNSQADYNAVYNAFGTQTLFGIDGVGIGWGNMNELIRYELSDSELDSLNNWLNARNITSL